MGLPGVPMVLAISSLEQTGECGTVLELRTHSQGRALSLPWDRILHPLCLEQEEGIPPCLQNRAAASCTCRRWGKRLVVSKAVEIFLACRLLLSLAISLGSSLSEHTGNNWGGSARPQAVDQQRE